MICIDGEHFIDTVELMQFLQIGVCAARRVQSDGKGIYTVKIGNKIYVSKERYKEYILKEM